MAYIDKVLVDGTTYDVQDSASVHFSAQTLTDAEKAQARTNVGAASAAEVSGLKNALVISSEVTYIPPGGNHTGTEITDKAGYIDTSGVYQSSGSYHSTDFIQLKANPTIYASFKGYTTVLNIAYYKEVNGEKTFISGIHPETNNGSVTGYQAVPSDAEYVRFCLPDANATGYLTYADYERYSTVEVENAKAELRGEIEAVDDRVDDIEAQIEKTTKVMVGEISGEGVQNGYIDTTGGYNSSASWKVTGYIPCKYTDQISEHVRGYTSVPHAVYYDKYKVFIGYEIPSENNKVFDPVLTFPNGAFYVRLNFVTTDTAQYYTITENEVKKSAMDIENALDSLYGKKLGAAGDSITIGTYSVPGMTYVNQIANAHNMTVDNQAIWGSVFPTGKTQAGQPQGSIYSQIASLSADCDMLIISGGINDADYQADESYWGSVSGGYSATLDTTTFCGAFEGTLKSALDKFKGKPILFVFEHRMTTKYQSQYGVHFEDVQYPLMIEMLNKWGIPYVDLFHDMPSIKLTPGYIALYSFDDQGIHPNIAGYRKFYVPRVESALEAIAK